jgi:hypothetical protein
VALFPDDRPPIAWSFFERVKGFGIMGVLMSLALCGFTLLLADIPAGVVPTAYAPSGVPLWPLLRVEALVSMSGLLTFAVLLPLYRYRRGGYAVGALVTVAVLVTMVLSTDGGPPTSFSVSDWPLALAAVAMIYVGARSGSYASDFMLNGREGAPPRQVG